ncbi:hypothetical protein [Brevundimonas sp.]|uniref:hypothetical protein n=1 Tax=Brevundimonas sp. TaxID=1871086 RepID=UPI002737E693|nr:hypothetical protein [Brevundimonas sp.]MDP3802640.1 hypothetical protein [Brevundimonas sp.]
MAPPAFKIRIIRPPAGEAPLWVREAWVGLELPLAHLEPVTVDTGGVLSGPTSRTGWWWARLLGRLHKTTGYCVNSARAIEILGRSRPEAANWWVTNAPRFTHPDEGFIFDIPACEPSPEPIANSPWG